MYEALALAWNSFILQAYGVVLWEICTLGGFPYPTVSDKDILKYLQQGNRLEKPASCSNEVFVLSVLKKFLQKIHPTLMTSSQFFKYFRV